MAIDRSAQGREDILDVLYFLKERTKFIRHFYETAAEPFLETIRRIEDDEPPFDQPPYSEDGEPPFMEEWSKAQISIEMLGRTSISMLSASLQLYLKTWEAEFGVKWQPKEHKKAIEDGFIAGYRTYFGDTLKISWDDCPVDFAMLEQVALARNRDQHPENITSQSVNHSRSDREKYPRPIFVSEADDRMFSDPEMAAVAWMSPTVHVSRESLDAAIGEVEKLAEWLEPKMFAAKFP
jgi:hypothetical protein